MNRPCRGGSVIAHACPNPPLFQPRIKISVNTDISVIGFYGNIGNIGKISADIFTKISVIKFFIYFNYIDYEK